ncbi:MAG: HAMP domain-containing sensor histidine kinase [Planctomycetota bacterium]|nr:HAMP domain-containing sensor histidine kinase [Planctomycetota bacterium]
MDPIPNSTLGALAAILMRERSAAWCRVDGDGVVRASGGDWQRYGESTPVLGECAADSFAALEGLLPVTDPITLHSLDMGAAGSGDLHVIPEPQGSLICILDSSPRTEDWRRLQQQGNEMALLHAELAKQALELGSAHHAPEQPNRALFEYTVEGACDLLTPVQSWLRPWLAGRSGSPQLAQLDPAGFLGNFLVDASDFWAGTAPGSLASGPWVEPGEAGEDQEYEAIALLDSSGAKGLILQRRLGSSMEETGLLQGVREAQLHLLAAHSEAQKKEVLLQCIVHDLRGPLSSMSAVLSILGQEGLAQDKRSKLLEVAQRQAQRQDEMMREVLTVFAREIRDLQRVERSPERAPDLVQVLRTTVRDRAPAFEQSGLGLEIESTLPDSVAVPGNGGRLSRVIGNLLDNARQYAPKDSGVQVHVEFGPAEKTVEVHVLDRGTGVPPHAQDRLFQRFSQVDTEPGEGKTRPGSVGLGLFFCRTSVEAWGGQVGYGDRPGGGADFWFRLPVLAMGQ